MPAFDDGLAETEIPAGAAVETDLLIVGSGRIAGLVAQDVQDALFADVGRWPVCEHCPAEAPVHSLFISPDLGGPDPVWVCEESGTEIAPLGRLSGD